MRKPSGNVVDLPVRRAAKAASRPGQVGTWRGGYIRQDQRGRRVYYISRRIGGVRFEVSTRCDREDAAEEHYRRFLLDPAVYTPRPPQHAREKPLVLDEELAGRFLDWSLNVKGNSAEWVALPAPAARLVGDAPRRHRPSRARRRRAEAAVAPRAPQGAAGVR